MTKIARITFNDYAGLQSGRIARIHGANGCSVEFIRQKDDGSVFLLDGPKGKQTLALAVTDEVRLDRHFKGFQQNAR